MEASPPPTSPSADPVHTTEPDAPSPTPASTPTATPEATPTSDPASGTGESLEVLADEKWEGIYDYNDWNEIQEALEEASKKEDWKNWPHIGRQLKNGYVWLIDGKAYVCAWEQWADVTMADTPKTIVERYRDYFIEITRDTRVFTQKDIIDYGSGHKTFDKNDLPKKGDLYWDGVYFWLLREDIPNEYNLPQDNGGCWQKILQPPRE